MYFLPKKYRVNILNIPLLKKLKNELWYLMITTKYQRQLDGKENLINEIEKMRKDKLSLWKQKKKMKNLKNPKLK